MNTDQRLGQWKAFDRVLMMLNSLAPIKGETPDQMRRRIYGEVMSMIPK
jgi:hypothetical protein